LIGSTGRAALRQSRADHDGRRQPVAGVETAHKVADDALPSNALMTRWPSSAAKPI
jgi:hypothetical protein